MQSKKTMHVIYITTLPILANCFIYFALTKWVIILKDRSAYLFKAMQYIKTVHLHKQTDFYLVTFTRNLFCNKNHNVRCWQAKREGVSVNMFVSKRRHLAWSPGRELLQSCHAQRRRQVGKQKTRTPKALHLHSKQSNCTSAPFRTTTEHRWKSSATAGHAEKDACSMNDISHLHTGVYGVSENTVIHWSQCWWCFTWTKRWFVEVKLLHVLQRTLAQTFVDS